MPTNVTKACFKTLHSTKDSCFECNNCSFLKAVDCSSANLWSLHSLPMEQNKEKMFPQKNIQRLKKYSFQVSRNDSDWFKWVKRITETCTKTLQMQSHYSVHSAWCICSLQIIFSAPMSINKLYFNWNFSYQPRKMDQRCCTANAYSTKVCLKSKKSSSWLWCCHRCLDFQTPVRPFCSSGLTCVTWNRHFWLINHYGACNSCLSYSSSIWAKCLFLKEIFLVLKNLEHTVPIINHRCCYSSLLVRVFLALAFGDCILISEFPSSLPAETADWEPFQAHGQKLSSTVGNLLGASSGLLLVKYLLKQHCTRHSFSSLLWFTLITASPQDFCCLYKTSFALGVYFLFLNHHYLQVM